MLVACHVPQKPFLTCAIIEFKALIVGCTNNLLVILESLWEMSILFCLPPHYSRYHLPPEGVAVYGGGPQGDLCGGPSMPRGSQRRTRRLRRHRQRLVTTSHDFESSGEALPPPPRFDNSVVLSVNPSGPPRRKVSADSTRSEETGVMVSVGTALAGDVVMVSCDDTRPLIDDDEQTT